MLPGVPAVSIYKNNFSRTKVVLFAVCRLKTVLIWIYYHVTLFSDGPCRARFIEHCV
ncbi:hypothetical protein NBRC116591_24450 [Sessilibacter corallicola]|uniref:Transposase n=1 Tax=Sessilibacter corallicola TaxID=2904075 RepID=A0ABQ0AAE7_9GAMM